jgi:hypothetical protein
MAKTKSFQTVVSGKPAVVSAIYLTETPDEDGSFGRKEVEGKAVPVQGTQPLIGIICANCEGDASHPLYHAETPFCSELCLVEGVGRNVLGVDERVLTRQRRERKRKQILAAASEAGMSLEDYLLEQGGAE